MTAPRVIRRATQPQNGGPHDLRHDLGLRYDRLPCPICTDGLVADYDTRGRLHHRACMVCGGRGHVGSGYTIPRGT